MNSPTNQTRLCGTLLNMTAVRYTPAGVPIRELRLAHQSAQVEAGHQRQVTLEIAALAAGDAVQQLEKLAIGDTCCISGFLNKKSLHNHQLVLHISSIQAFQE